MLKNTNWDNNSIIMFVYYTNWDYLCNTINQSYKYINLNSKSNGNKREFLEK